ncbi:Meiotic nuclear division protein 1 [Paragonimus heterotremus]|uniref:Meiotic nuclear division protein 1 homolog n=1 Tax=Paragonimus heterotremus TaxID=100268 RepID=A0A8J4SVB4_9TREM|nr:Meiotic nuclear division protein 1 [Paragonimus heterotremus]
MMEFFYEKRDFFQLKEIERLCSKEKGINAMSVKDVLMSLVHDGMVDTDKIGTCVYFWAFPNKAAHKHKNTLQKLKDDIRLTEQQSAKCQLALDQLNSARPDTAERRELLEELQRKRAILEQLSSELCQLRKFDPKLLDSLKRDRLIALSAANRWTGMDFPIFSFSTLT